MSHQYFSITKRFLMVSSAAILTLTGYTSPVTAQVAPTVIAKPSTRQVMALTTLLRCDSNPLAPRHARQSQLLPT